MLEFQLFRIKTTTSNQGDLFDSITSRRDALEKTIRSVPIKEIRKNKIWQIGNIKVIDKNSLYCRIGRNSKRTIEVYEDGKFIDQEFDTAPYTHLIIELHLSICAIAKKSSLSPKTKGIASNFQRLLNQSDAAQLNQLEFTVSELKDPDDFISYLNRSYSIKKFWTTFTKPNPFDVNEYIKPMERLVEASNGDLGKTELKGENLDKNIIEDLSRSAASTGSKASARLQESEGAETITKRLGDRPVTIHSEDVEDLKKIINSVRNQYHNIREKK